MLLFARPCRGGSLDFPKTTTPGMGVMQQFSLCDGDGSPNPKPEIRNPKEIREPKADSASSPFNAEAQRFAEVLLGKS